MRWIELKWKEKKRKEKKRKEKKRKEKGRKCREKKRWREQDRIEKIEDVRKCVRNTPEMNFLNILCCDKWFKSIFLNIT